MFSGWGDRFLGALPRNRVPACQSEVPLLRTSQLLGGH